MRILFLDIDGVLNGHEKLPGSIYCGIRPDCMAELNRVIAATGCVLVITSAWRYQILLNAMTRRGFEYMLASHGLILPANGDALIVGNTREDESPPNCDRGEQILEWLEVTEGVKSFGVGSWAVVDDDPMKMRLGEHAWRLVKTLPERGLQPCNADHLIEIMTH